MRKKSELFSEISQSKYTSQTPLHMECHAPSGKLQHIMGSRPKVRKSAPKLAEPELFEYSVKYLAQRACASEELRTRLRRRAANARDIDAVIARLKEVGYLDDQKFAETYASSRAGNEGFGRLRVLSDLRSRRIAPSTAEKAVAEVFEGKEEADLIDAYIERRMPSLQIQGLIEDQRELAKAYRRLRRAGFSSAGVMSALRRRAARPEEIEEPLDEAQEGDEPL
jgi:regulatory protein